MKKLLTSLLFLSFFFTTILAAFSQPTEPYLVKKFAFKNGGQLTASTLNGDITVIGTDDRMASVALLVTDPDGNFRKAAIDKAFHDYEVEIKEENHALSAHISRKDGEMGRPTDLKISLRIYVPEKTVCDLKATGGSITINYVKGNSRAITAGGELRMCQYAGALQAETHGGAITLNEAQGTLKMHSAGGSITLKKVTGDVQAYSEGGNITADIRQLGNYLTLETKDGSLKATIPGNRGLDLDLAGSLVKTDLENFQGQSGQDKIIGSINGGGVPVKLHTQTGETELRYRL